MEVLEIFVSPSGRINQTTRNELRKNTPTSELLLVWARMLHASWLRRSISCCTAVSGHSCVFEPFPAGSPPVLFFFCVCFLCFPSVPFRLHLHRAGMQRRVVPTFLPRTNRRGLHDLVLYTPSQLEIDRREGYESSKPITCRVSVT